MIDRATVFRRNPRVEFRELGEEGGAVLLHLETGAYHGTNEVGALVWDMLGEGGMAFGALVDRLRSELEETPEDLESEISEFLDELAGRHLVLREEPTAS